MSVAARLLVLQNAYLNVHRFDRRSVSVVQREHIPAQRLHEFNNFDLLQLMETISNSYGYLLRCVALISFEVKVECNLAHSCFLQELDVH